MTDSPRPTQALLELSTQVGSVLSRRSLTIAPAESCSGGLLSSYLTDVNGSSAYMLGGIVSYSNHAKTHLLGVQESTLATFGAVSPETAAEMAQGVRKLVGADIGISTTGIAGPTGGTPDKPVGLVYLHVSAQGIEEGERSIWPYDRMGNKLATVGAALSMVLRLLSPRQMPDSARTQVEFLDHPVIVEASWSQRNWRPQAVWFEGKRWEIIGWGRQTLREDGMTEVLVEASEGIRFELLVDVQGGQWLLRRIWRARTAV
ncbi:MAG: CinA family protein [Chloroflexi bacterium]|nr:CinA family protein [Chloroflexota bacterium]